MPWPSICRCNIQRRQCVGSDREDWSLAVRRDKNSLVSQLTSELKLRHNSLRANLQHCADLGLEAFLEAEGRMKKLQLVAEIVNSDGGFVGIVSSKRVVLSIPGLGDDFSD